MLYLSCHGSSGIFLASWLSISLRSKNKCLSKYTYKMGPSKNNNYRNRDLFNSSMISCIGLTEPKNIKFCIYLNSIKKSVQMKNVNVEISSTYMKKTKIKTLASKYSTDLLMSLSGRP